MIAGPPLRKESSWGAAEGLPGQRGDVRLKLKRAFHPGRQVAREVINPIARIRPTSLPALRTIDREGLGNAGIPEGDHLLRKPHRYLADALDRPLRYEYIHLRARRGLRR